MILLALSVLAISAIGSALLINLQRQKAERLAEAESVARTRAEQSEQRSDKVLDYLVSLFEPTDPNVSGIDLKISEVLRHGVGRVAEDFVDDPAGKAKVMGAIASAYLRLGMFDEGVSTARRALEVAATQLPSDHVQTLVCQEILANACSEAGQYGEAIELRESLYPEYLRRFGADHPATIRVLQNLARVCGVAGRFDDAAQYYAQLSEAARDTDVMIEEAVGRAQVLLRGERHRECIELCQGALEFARGELGDRHPDTITLMNTLANALSQTQRYEEAQQVYEQAIEAARRTFGPHHPDTITFEANYNALLTAIGRDEEAVELLRGHLRAHTESLGEEHPSTLSARNNLADALTQTGRLEEAIPHFEATLELREQTLGKEHPNTLTSLQNLGRAYTAIGRTEDAAKIFQTAIDRMAVTLGKTKLLFSTQRKLAYLYRDSDRLEEAMDLFREAWVGLGQAIGPDSPLAVDSAASLGRIHLRIGDYEAAAKILEEILPLVETRSGLLGEDTTLSVVICIKVLGLATETELAMGNLNAAEQTAAQLTPLVQQTKLPMANAIVDYVLGQVAFARKDYARAEELLVRPSSC